VAGAGDLALAGPQAGQVAGCAAAGRSPAVAAGDNSKRREGVTVTRGGRESGGVPDPGPAAGPAAGPGRRSAKGDVRNASSKAGGCFLFLWNLSKREIYRESGNNVLVTATS